MNTRTFALIFGIVFLIIGAGGFIPGLTDMTATPEAGLTMHNGYGHELGLFPINILHNIVHLLFGIWGILAYRSYGGARTYFRAVAIIYGRKLRGVVAWAAWAAIHIMTLIDYRNRFAVMANWLYAYITRRRPARLIRASK